jgi:molybdopterin molybdotransferase
MPPGLSCATVPDLITIDDALQLVLAHAAALDAETVDLREAAGRVLAVDAAATVDLPPFDSSAMDGYAVRAADTPGALQVVGHSAAGHPAGAALRAGEAIEISTGAVVPDGADAVVPVERTTPGVTVEAVAPGENVRPRGGDVRAGEIVAHAGASLGPARIGALASAGVASVSCARRPRVAILATGSELRPPGTQLGPGQIYESNSLLLAALVASAGGKPVRLEPASDDEAATRDALERALDGSDVLLTSGGVSVGPHDLVRAALETLGAKEIFWRVAVKPGKPIAFSTAGATLVFGLPGNPVSTLVGFELFVRPALRALQGEHAPGPRYLPGVLGAPLRRGPDRDELVRARLVDGELQPVTGQESHMIARSSSADALVLVPRGEGELAVGAQVSWLALSS